jgi:hypothetical protein
LWPRGRLPSCQTDLKWLICAEILLLSEFGKTA